MSSPARSRAINSASAVSVCLTNRREIAERDVDFYRAGHLLADRLGGARVPPGRHPGQHPLHHHPGERALTQAIERAGDDHGPARWQVRIDRVGDYLIRSDGEHWSLVWLGGPDQPAPPRERSADVFVAADEASFAQFVIDPTPDRAADLNIDIRGEAEARGRFERLVGAFTRSIPT